MLLEPLKSRALVPAKMASPEKNNDVAAFVLAGGKSSRMGRDKAFAELAGKTLLERALAVARAVAPDVRIVGFNPRLVAFASEHKLALIADRFAERGPLAGIHAALRSSKSELNFVLSVDCPFITAECAKFLVQTAWQNSALATVADVAGGIHPVSAVYRREFADFAERALAAGKNKIGAVLADVPTAFIREDELLRAGFSPEMFDNVNTPQDLARAAARLDNLRLG
jgi:molybdopterin-guanine dinucleotide biosynthesis protein A